MLNNKKKKEKKKEPPFGRDDRTFCRPSPGGEAFPAAAPPHPHRGGDFQVFPAGAEDPGDGGEERLDPAIRLHCDSCNTDINAAGSYEQAFYLFYCILPSCFFALK